MKARRISTRVSDELADLVEQTVKSSPLIGGRGPFARHALRLALHDAVERDLITDPEVQQRVNDYLQRSAIAIGEPLGNGKVKT